MKKTLLLSIVTSTLMIAGGDIEPVVDIPKVMEATTPAYKTGFYLGLGYSTLELDEDDNGDNDNWTGDAYTLIAGYNYNQYLAVEGRYSSTVGDLSYESNGASSVDYDGTISNFAVYLKPQYPMGALSVYALLGYGQVSVDYTNEGGYEGDQNSFQWGIGGAYSLTDSVDVFVDYTQFYNDSSFDDQLLLSPNDYDINGLTFGVNYRF